MACLQAPSLLAELLGRAQNNFSQLQGDDPDYSSLLAHGYTPTPDANQQQCPRSRTGIDFTTICK